LLVVQDLALSGDHADCDLGMDGLGSYSLPTMPGIRDTPFSASSSSFAPHTPTPNFSNVAVSKASSRAGTPKPKSASKRTLQDVLAEGSAKDSQVIERLGTQKHERVIVELDLKHRKLDHMVMKEQHQREREREQHEFRMLQMRMMMLKNQPAASGLLVSQDSDGFGSLMGELNAPTGSSSSLNSYSV
jgi:hypothetical protein